MRAYNFKIRKAVACYIPKGGFYGYRRRKRGNAFCVYVNIIKAVRLSFFKRNIAAYTQLQNGDPSEPAVTWLVGYKLLGGKCAVALRSPCNLFNLGERNLTSSKLVPALKTFSAETSYGINISSAAPIFMLFK